ncbi:OsmC family protein [Gordonia sp. (in: high G+C Gram-positive bacteria)]|uniref:OsmC family protein n=1 Tax=Gordonia sp. (in: high G+C Gram-positive bacteria) TaxID=84139 RepID=UPI003F99F35A
MTRAQDSDDGSLNGISAAHRDELSARLKDRERVSTFSGPWEVEATWRGGFRVGAKARSHAIEFDEPADLTAQDSSPTPHEYVLSAVAACITDGVILHATTRGIRIDNLEVRVTGTFENILLWAGLATDGNPGFGSLQVSGRISGNADTSTLTELWNRAISGSPVAQTISRPTTITSHLRVDPHSPVAH